MRVSDSVLLLSFYDTLLVKMWGFGVAHVTKVTLFLCSHTVLVLFLRKQFYNHKFHSF